MQPTPQPTADLKRFQVKVRASVLFAQLPDHDQDEARDTVAEFVRMAAAAGLVDNRQRSAKVVRLFTRKEVQ